jgi:metal-responsive CopG/Arc/MetJ family transcriptional regulator
MDEDEVRPYQIRLSTSFWKKVDEWRRQQSEIPPRSEAIRRLVEAGLAAEQRTKPKR